MNVEGRLKTLDFRTLIHVGITASHRDGEAIEIELLSVFLSLLLLYSVSCGLSAAAAPADSDRHRTDPNLFGPASGPDYVHIVKKSLNLSLKNVMPKKA